MATTQALIFTAYMLPVSMIDNVLKPVLMARGLVAPIPVVMIGVVGGTLTYGVRGAIPWANRALRRLDAGNGLDEGERCDCPSN